MKYIIEFETDHRGDAEYVKRRTYDAINEVNIKRGNGLLRERDGLPANPPENGKEIDRVPMLTWAYRLGPRDVWQAACWHDDDGEWWDDCSFTPLRIQPELYWRLPEVDCDDVR